MSNDKAIQAAALAVEEQLWDLICGGGGNQEIVEGYAKRIVEAAAPIIRAEVIEECAKLADQLGGDRERLHIRDGDDKHARADQVNRAQHVRAKTIATAIRFLGRADHRKEASPSSP